MGHYCRICERIRPNEKFSGKGHKTQICKECLRLPNEEREKTDLEAELTGFVKQSRISKKNVKRLQELTGHADATVARRAELLIRVARIAEGKRKRWRKVSRTDRGLLFACGEAGLLDNWIPEDLYRASGALVEDDDGLDGWECDDAARPVEQGDSLLEDPAEDWSEEEEIPFDTDPGASLLFAAAIIPGSVGPKPPNRDDGKGCW